MKYIYVYALFLISIFHTSYGQNQTNVPQDNISKGLYSESQLKEAATSKVPMSVRFGAGGGASRFSRCRLFLLFQNFVTDCSIKF